MVRSAQFAILLQFAAERNPSTRNIGSTTELGALSLWRLHLVLLYSMLVYISMYTLPFRFMMVQFIPSLCSTDCLTVTVFQGSLTFDAENLTLLELSTTNFTLILPNSTRTGNILVPSIAQSGCAGIPFQTKSDSSASLEYIDLYSPPGDFFDSTFTR